MDVMIDIETVSTRPDAQMLQIGAVFFEAKSGGTIDQKNTFNRFIQIQDGVGSVDHDTLGFWMQQISKDPKHPMVEGMRNAMPLNQALADFVLWPTTVGASWGDINTIWAKPSNFDLPIVQSALAKFGIAPPWDHRATRCARTLFSVTGEPAVDWTGLKAHDAVDDCIGQAMGVQMAMGMISMG